MWLGSGGDCCEECAWLWFDRAGEGDWQAEANIDNSGPSRVWQCVRRRLSKLTCLVTRKSLAAGLKLGALFGLASGISMGWGFYGFMPIPLSLAWGWFLGILINYVLAGALVGAIVKSREETS